MVAAIAACASLVVGIINIISSIYAANKKIEEDKRIKAREEIYKKLDDFYGPFQQYLNNRKELFEIFAADKPKEFRTLTYLLDRNQEYLLANGAKGKMKLTDSDKELLNEIVSVGEKMENLIIDRAGLIDDPELRYDYHSNPNLTDVNWKGNGLLAYVKTHFQVIRLAKMNRLQGSVEKYKNCISPRELNQLIEDEIVKLQAEFSASNS